MNLWAAFLSALKGTPGRSIGTSFPIEWTGYRKETTMPDASDQRREFVKAISLLARAIEVLSGIPWALCITQAAHESDFGRSGLSVQAHNLFGVTGDTWKKQGLPVIDMPTREWVSGKPTTMTRPFRLYQSYGESLLDWARLIVFSYPKAVAAARAGNSAGFFDELQKGGYATDPKYAEQLWGVLEIVKSFGDGRIV
jgi:flagellar protein FlgJ